MDTSEDIYIEKKCDMPDKYIITVISSTEKNNLIHAAELAINLCHRVIQTTREILTLSSRNGNQWNQ